MKIFIDKSLYHDKIPNERRICTIILFKKDDRELPANNRGINLPYHVKTNHKINEQSSLADEQNGFRPGRWCMDAVFVIRQITVKYKSY